MTPRCVKAVLALAALAASLAPSGGAEAGCVEDVRVVGATVTFKTRMFQGRASRKDAIVQVDLRSTATTAVSAVELGLFLGVSMADIDHTRVSALPTQQARVFDDGGMAFRTRVSVMLPPGSTRSVRVRREAVPRELDLYGVRAIVGGCTRVTAVSDVQVVMPKSGGDLPVGLVVAGLFLTLLTTLMLIWRLR